jgi:heparosan-N-sulfate-glucuronate 5-epimerase
MAEALQKIALYFRKQDAYWQLSDDNAPTKIDSGDLGRYPLNFVPRLTTGHFTSFDPEGLPVHTDKDGRGLIHNYTTMSAFAFANWTLYLETGQEDYLKKLLLVADYILRTGEWAGEGALRLRTECAGTGHTGDLSAMFQGEAISVLCRAWQATGDGRYLEAAVGCVGPFDTHFKEEGVRGQIQAANNATWYEEWPNPQWRHALNGMIYSLWGLRDVAIAADHTRAEELFQEGVESVLKALPLFDSGYWSWYCLPENKRPHIASMMYHNLHICQLTALARQTERPEFKPTIERFVRYAGSTVCRFRAAAEMVNAKVLRR